MAVGGNGNRAGIDGGDDLGSLNALALALALAFSLGWSAVAGGVAGAATGAGAGNAAGGTAVGGAMVWLTGMSGAGRAGQIGSVSQ